MQYDCGSLRANPRQSATFRFLTEHRYRTRQTHWPKGVRREAAIFAATPGVSWQWLDHVLGLNQTVVAGLLDSYDDLKEQGMANMLTATYDDALNYVRRAPPQSRTPPWVMVFMMEDKKRMGWRPLRQLWGSRYKAAKKFVL